MSENSVKTITAMVAVFGLLFGGLKFLRIQSIDAKKPYLEKKLEWCEESVRLASTIAARTKLKMDSDPSDKFKFYSLSDGVMAMVENSEIKAAMIKFEEEIDDEEAIGNNTLALVDACRKELADDWLGW